MNMLKSVRPRKLNPSKRKIAEIKRYQSGGKKTALIIGDPHFPYVDKPLWEKLCEFCEILRPDKRVWIGDIFDFYQCSKFDKSPKRKHSMIEEISKSKPFIEQLVAVGSAQDIALPGNHEARLRKRIWRDAELSENLGLDDITWHGILGLDDMGFTVHDFDGDHLPVISLGHLHIYHGDRTNKHAVVNIVNDWGCSVLYGHTHRMRSFVKTTYDTTHGVWENGYLASTKLSKQYMKGVADWQQGFSVVHYDPDDGWFHVTQVPVCRVPERKIKRFMYQGDIYECKIEKEER